MYKEDKFAPTADASSAERRPFHKVREEKGKGKERQK